MNRITFCMMILLHCISANLVSATGGRVIGGRPTLLGEIPWQVSLRRSYNDHHFCGGSLVTSDHILTTAHCMYYIWGGLLPSFTVSAVVGQLNLAVTSTTIYRNASEIIIHPDFNRTTLANDMAVIKVDLPFPVDDDDPLVKIVAMRNSSINSGRCVVSGWGVEQYESEIVSNVLLSAEVGVIPFDECEKKYRSTVNLAEGMLCAGHPRGETDACQGDSGGPLVCDGLLTGVISTGSGCGNPNYPGIYSDVAHYLPWIKVVVQSGVAPSTDDDGITSTESPTSGRLCTSFAVTLAPKIIPEHNSSSACVKSFPLVLAFYACYAVTRLWLVLEREQHFNFNLLN